MSERKHRRPRTNYLHNTADEEEFDFESFERDLRESTPDTIWSRSRLGRFMFKAFEVLTIVILGLVLAVVTLGLAWLVRFLWRSL